MRKRYQITITEEALSDLAAIKDRGVRTSIQTKIGQLATEPAARGKPLTDDLKGHYRVKAQRRWRIIYQVAEFVVGKPRYTPLKRPATRGSQSVPEGFPSVTGADAKGLVVVVVIGIRKEGDKRDVYQVAKKRLP